MKLLIEEYGGAILGGICSALFLILAGHLLYGRGGVLLLLFEGWGGLG